MEVASVSLETAVYGSFANQQTWVAAGEDGIIPKKGGYITCSYMEMTDI